MTELFADGIRSVAVANGVVRVELVQLKRDQDAPQLNPQASGSLILPVTALKDFTLQFVKTLERVEQRNKETKAASDAIEEDGSSDLDEALEQL